MKRTAVLAILFLLFAWTGLAMYPGDPITFLVAFTADGKLVVASHRGGIQVLSVPDLKEVRSFPLETGRRLRSATVSPNGKWVVAEDDSGDLRVWDLQSGEAQPSIPKINPYPVYLFRPGSDILFIYQKNLAIWDVKQGREVGVVEPVKSVERMAMSTDGHQLVVFGSCSAGRVNGDVCTYAIDEKNIVAAASRDELFSDESGQKHNRNPADLVCLEDGRILVMLDGLRSRPNTVDLFFLKPGDLQVMGKPFVVERGQQRSYAGSRSAPGGQLMAVSLDGRWKTTASAYQKQLYLYRVTPDGQVLEKYMRIP